MGALLLSEIVKQLAYVDVLGAGGGALVEVARLDLHRARLVADGLQAQRAHQPDRLAMDETSYVLTAEEWDVVAEFLAVELQETVPVSGFFGSHAVEDGCGCGKVLAKALGEIG